MVWGFVFLFGPAIRSYGGWPALPDSPPYHCYQGYFGWFGALFFWGYCVIRFWLGDIAVQHLYIFLGSGW